MTKSYRQLFLRASFVLIFFSAFFVYPQSGSVFTDDKKAREVFMSGNMQEAIRHFNELLKINKNNKEYNAFIGYAYLVTNIDKKKAVEHLQRAIQNKNNDPYLHYDLGRAYLLTYNFDKAIESFNTFISKGGKEDGDDLPAKRLIEMCENAKNLIPLRVNVTIQNMGEAINTPFPDYFPFIDENESVLYFTTKRDKNSPAVTDIDGFKTADIYFSEFNGETWSKAKRMPNTINSAYIEEIVGLSADGETMLIAVDNEYGMDDIFISTKSKKNFLRSERLGNTVNTLNREKAAMISPDGNWLFFSSDTPGGYGGLDIYYSKKLPNGDWSFPFNAGNIINTEYDDNFPYIAPDGTTFYFASQGHNSIGGYDLFVSKWDEQNLLFSTPENVGYPINTPDDNRTISVSKSGRYAYVSDFRENGLGELDIYKVTFLDVTPPYYILFASLYSSDSILLANREINQSKDYKLIVKEPGSKKNVGTFRPNLHNQQFSIVLPPGFYIFELWSNNLPIQSFEYIVPDREPSDNELTIPIYLNN